MPQDKLQGKQVMVTQIYMKSYYILKCTHFSHHVNFTNRRTKSLKSEDQKITLCKQKVG